MKRTNEHIYMHKHTRHYSMIACKNIGDRENVAFKNVQRRFHKAFFFSLAEGYSGIEHFGEWWSLRQYCELSVCRVVQQCCFICLASSLGWARSCRIWASWRGPRSCRSSLACRCGGRCLVGWWAGVPLVPPNGEKRDKGVWFGYCFPKSGAYEGIHLTFMPISMFERSANGTSLVTSSQSNTAKLHMSAERRLISSGFFCRAERRCGGRC